MRRDKEQALNPPECGAIIKRQYIPMREWDGVINGVAWFVKAEVEAEKNAIVCSIFDAESAIYVDNEGAEHKFAGFLLASTPPNTSKTWRELIETDICYQAEELSKKLPFLWRTEYQEATYE